MSPYNPCCQRQREEEVAQQAFWEASSRPITDIETDLDQREVRQRRRPLGS